MDTEKVILLSGLGFVIVVGAFILFGPSTRPRRRPGQICGLVNLGNTCFLNSLLQALASCPIIVEWLSYYANNKNSFIEALHTSLLVVNGQHPYIFEDPYTPGNVIKCLYRKGWTISPGEHDVHELLNVIMTTVEEEIHLSHTSKVSSLADLLCVEAEETEDSQQNMSNSLVSNQNECLFQNSIYDTENVMDQSSYVNLSPTQQVANDVASVSATAIAKNSHENDVIQLKKEHSDESDETAALEFNDINEEYVLDNVVGHVESCLPHVERGEHLNNSSQALSDGINRDTRNRQTISTTGIVRHIQTCIRNTQLPGLKGSSVWAVPPCEGMLAGQTACTRCKYKSPVKYDKFGCISLPLPPSRSLYSYKTTLHQLLGKFVSPELINGVSCEKCEKEPGDSRSSISSIFKTYNLGKLPPCLIFHIQRTMWQSNGVSKRHDYIEFPEILSMHTYIYGQIQKKLNELTSIAKGESSHRKVPVVIDRFKHLYRLSAVIVHKGDVEHGHFVTYRRSLVHPNRWYYISDTEVLESSLNEVLQTSAYMLFYNKCQSN